MDAAELAKTYQWHDRRQCPERPSWFTEWPQGNRIAVTFNIMHEWESVPRSNTLRKRAMSPDSPVLDFLALGAREYGANFGFKRLLNILDKFDVKATVFTSGLTAQLFPATLKDAVQRGHEIACHHLGSKPTSFRLQQRCGTTGSDRQSDRSNRKSQWRTPIGLHVTGPPAEPLHPRTLRSAGVPLEW